MLKPLRDNALFLACWYERTRPIPLACLGLVYASIVAIAWLYLTSPSSHAGTDPKMFSRVFLGVFVGLQTLALLFQAPFFAARLAGRERSSSTLDFHRSSPESVWDKITGLVAGATGVEWICFLGFTLLGWVQGLFLGIPIGKLFLFTGLMTLTGVFLQTASAALGLAFSRKRSRASPLTIFFALFFLLPMAVGLAVRGVTFGFSFMGHVLGITAFVHLSSSMASSLGLTGHFFSLELPLPLMQLMAQLPLLALMVAALRRIFLMPNSPFWSRADMLFFNGFVLCLFTGTLLPSLQVTNPASPFLHVLNLDTPGAVRKWFSLLTLSYLTLFLWLGIGTAAVVRPSWFQAAKHHALRKAGERSLWFRLMGEGGSGLAPVLLYLLLGALFYAFFAVTLGLSLPVATGCFLLLSYGVVFFAGLLEFSGLSRFRHNKIFLLTVLGLFWIAAPIMVGILTSNPERAAVLTPFAVVKVAADMMFQDRGPAPVLLAELWALSLAVWFLAIRARASMHVDAPVDPGSDRVG